MKKFGSYSQGNDSSQRICLFTLKLEISHVKIRFYSFLADFTCEIKHYELWGAHFTRELGIFAQLRLAPTPSQLVLPILAWLLLGQQSAGRFVAGSP